MPFTYQEIFSRNIGFVSEAEQDLLCRSKVVITGVGGMGSAALATLVRSGVGNFVISDPDEFELHNLNRQVFANVTTLGKSKSEQARIDAEKINPQVKVATHSLLEGEALRDAVRWADVVINGCDDPKASIALHRESRAAGKVCIDALAALMPNVVVCKPGSDYIEELFKSPARDQPLAALSPEVLKAHAEAELRFVMLRSRSLDYAQLQATREFMSGKRKRFSFAPMVITTGNLMAFEALRILAHRIDSSPNTSVYFFDPWRRSLDTPARGPRLWINAYKAWRFMRSL